MMGSSAGNYLGAQIAGLTARVDNPDAVIDAADSHMVRSLAMSQSMPPAGPLFLPC